MFTSLSLLPDGHELAAAGGGRRPSRSTAGTRSLMTVGAITVAIGLVMRLRAMSQWIMWEVAAAVREHRHRRRTASRMLAKPVSDHRQAGRARRSPFRRARSPSITCASTTGAARAKVIEDFTLTIRPGEKVGLVGRSGAGKSTIVNLLLRFYDLEGGRILIDGQDIAGVTQESLRRQIGMVTQDTSLLHRSVRDNILYGRPDADRGRRRARRGARPCRRVHPRSRRSRRGAPATTPMSASAASSCPAASASASPSPASS